MPTPQNFKNHSRFNPLFHFFIVPLLLLNLIFSIYITIHHWPLTSTLFSGRSPCPSSSHDEPVSPAAQALSAQDRIIRLEERLRLYALLPA